MGYHVYCVLLFSKKKNVHTEGRNTISQSLHLKKNELGFVCRLYAEQTKVELRQ